MISRQVIYFQGKAYLLIRRILDDPKYTGNNLDLVMEWCGADKVLRKEGYLYFLDEIEELEILGDEEKN